MQSYRFDGFELDPQDERLSKDGTPVKLQGQPLQLLHLLLQRRGRLVSRPEIIEHLWDDDTHVDFDMGINAVVRQLRKALGDDADRPRYIETVPRHGYRFIADTPTSRRWPWVAAAASVLAAIALIWTFNVESARDDARPVLAVLPFENLGADERDDYLGDGMTEELIALLGGRHPRRLAVIARTSSMKYKGTGLDIAEIADELEADFLLEGSIRRENGTIRVTAQLIRAADRSHVWANQYERSSAHVLELQHEVGDRIAEALALTLLDSEGRGPDPEAWDAYLRGRHLMRQGKRESLPQAKAQLEQALELDPSLAVAHLAYARLLQYSLPKGEDRSGVREHLRKALALDEANPDTHLAYGNHLFYEMLDVEKAGRHYEKALDLRPAFAEAHHAYAGYLAVTGRRDEAIESVQQALRLDPVAAYARSDVGWYFYFAGRYDEAVEHSLRTLELDPDYYYARLMAILGNQLRGDEEAALEFARKELQRYDDAPARLVDLNEFWSFERKRLQILTDEGYPMESEISRTALLLGERDDALDSLERAFRERRAWVLPFLQIDPVYKPLRGDPRFERLLQAISAQKYESVDTARL